MRQLMVFLLLGGCSGRVSGRGDDDDGAGDGDADSDADADVDADADADADADGGTEGEDRPAPGLGVGDHTVASVRLVAIAEGASVNQPTGLGFPSDNPGDLWIVNRRDDSWTIVEDVASPDASIVRFVDDSSHFLNAPSSITFSDDEQVAATCQQSANDYNGFQPDDFWMGPVAWTTDRQYFDGGHLSHYDMAHEEPFCMGIAWSEAHVFWAFNDFDNAIDRVDFHEWHPDPAIDGPGDLPAGLGGEDHTDGEVWRYVQYDVEGVEGVPSHMVVNHDDGYLYVCDSGNARIVRLDTTFDAGRPALSRFGEMGFFVVDDVELEEVVPRNVVALPSGIALHDGLLYVTDHADGRLLAFTTNGEMVNWLETGLGQEAVTAIAVADDGTVYFADTVDDVVYRVQPCVVHPGGSVACE